MKLRKTDEFSSVFNFKCVKRGECLDIFSAPNGLDAPRLGLIVSKRFLRRAVDRNRAKRLIREAFRLKAAGLGGVDVIFRVKKNCLDNLGKHSRGYQVDCESLETAVNRCRKRAVTTPQNE